MFFRLLNAILRPKLATALVGSAVMHAGLLGFVALWRLEHLATVQFSGQRAAAAVELTVVIEESVEPAEQGTTAIQMSPVSPQAAEIALQPRPLTVPRVWPRGMRPQKRRIEPPRDSPPATPVAVTLQARTEAVPRHVPKTDPQPLRRTARPRPKPPQMMTRAQPPAAAGDQTVSRPNFSVTRPPAYPRQAVVRRWEGTVRLLLHVDATGRVHKADVLKSSGYPILDREAVRAVTRWRGRPAMRGDKAVASTLKFDVNFEL